MQRKQQVGECWVCVIFFVRVVVSALYRVQRSREIVFASGNVSHFWVVFWHMVFVDGFLFPVKELGLLTNPGHWVRVLDVIVSYIYILL
jgi:hypothetical protein